jgi:Protein of unknown function (DUF998)
VTRSAELGTGGSRPGRPGPESGAGQERDLAVRAAPVWPVPVHERRRAVAAWVLGIAGLAAYNWWLLVPFKPGLMSSPNELFSNLEVSGQPYATLMQHADLAAGLLLIAAFWAAGHGNSRAARREWLSMLVFAAAGALGGLFPEVCADGVNAVCRRQEYRFELPASQYIHSAAGILEFAAITVALIYAVRRTRRQPHRPAAAYRVLAVAALVAYPLLGGAYLFDRFGGIMEAVFFTGFSVMVITELAERATVRRAAPRDVPSIREYYRV